LFLFCSFATCRGGAAELQILVKAVHAIYLEKMEIVHGLEMSQKKQRNKLAGPVAYWLEG
jgi:hypothetical protein